MIQKFAVLTHNASLLRLVTENFAGDTVTCDPFQDDVSLSRAMYRDDYSVIFIDFERLGATGAVLQRRHCYADRRAPLIMIGTFHDRASIEMAFSAGADEVLVAPFSGNELAVRTYQTLRRFDRTPPRSHDDTIVAGPYRLERRTASIVVGDEYERLTPREFAIAWLLFSHAGEYVSRRQIAGAVWGSTEDIVGRTLEQHIYKLRRKLRLNGSLGVHLRTMYAHGYRVELKEESSEVVTEAADRHGNIEQENDRDRDLATPGFSTAGTPTPVRMDRIEPTDRYQSAISGQLTGATRQPLLKHSPASEAARAALPWSATCAFGDLVLSRCRTGAMVPCSIARDEELD